MSDEDSGAEKPFEATPERLKQARKKGQIAKSNDLIFFGASFGMLLSLLAFQRPILNAIQALIGQLPELIVASATEPDVQGIHLGLGSMIVQLAWPAMALPVLPLVFAILIIAAQRAFLVTPSNIAPKLNRLSLLQNFKKKFGLDGLFEFLKSTAKLLLYSFIAWRYVNANLEPIAALFAMEPAQGFSFALRHLLRLLTQLTVVVGLVAGVDYLWQRHSHLKKNRMSRKDMEEEVKNSEGDQHAKSARRQKGQEIALNQMLGEVPQATVVIVNPTHYAVALTWDRASPSPPICVAKGVDEIAAAIRRTAIENGVPIHSDPPTARALYADVEIGDIIRTEHFAVVAAAIRFADDMRKKASLF